MKNLFQITSLIFVFFIISLNSVSAGYWYSGSNTDLYKYIDKGVDELGAKMYEYEISGGGGSIKNEVNRILQQENLPPCLEVEITAEELKEISGGDLKILSEKMGTNCFPIDTQTMSTSTLISIQSKINDIDVTSEKKAEKKESVMHRIAEIGIYSDGSLENSPFDLISDMQEIDEIIFSEEIVYEGEQNYDISGMFEDFLEEKGEESASNNGLNSPQPLSNSNNLTNAGNTSYACLEDINTSNGVNPYFSDVFSNNISSETPELEAIDFGDYEKITDNLVWPCTDIFCIEVEFKTYEHQLLGAGGDGDFTIESILNRSNEHLKKFTNVSLAQSKMGQNLFELNLRDISLPDSFHVGLVVTKKPIPILDVEKEGSKDKGEFAYENILYEYYKNLGMDYPRKNSLVKYSHKEEKLKSFLDSVENPITLAEKKEINFENNLEIVKKKNEYFRKAITKKIQTEEITVFYNNLAEIERFIGAINDYTTGLFGAVRGMDRIPVHRNG